MSNLDQLIADVHRAQDPDHAVLLQRFFKTAPGEYGHGDIFLGLTVPICRQIAKKYFNLNLKQLIKLLHSPSHEHRLIALVILTHQFERGSADEQSRIYDLYLRSSKYINNWDLVDISAGKIVGRYLLDKDRSVLAALAKSNLLWDRRIAIIATSAFISRGESEDTFAIATILLHDSHDLIHKAVGWMLREVGKYSTQEIEESFLQKHYKHMPRTMLRYAIERFPEPKRRQYLSKD